MKYLVVAVAIAALAVVATEARATPTSLVCGGTSCAFGGTLTAPGAFTDVFGLGALGLGPFGSTSGTIVTLDLNDLAPGFNIDFTSVFLTSGAGSHAFTLSGPLGFETGFLLLGTTITGPLTLTVMGTTDSTGATPGTYVGNVSVTLAVPEPASLLLLGAGLAGIGIWSWRRKSTMS